MKNFEILGLKITRLFMSRMMDRKYMATVTFEVEITATNAAAAMSLAKGFRVIESDFTKCRRVPSGHKCGRWSARYNRNATSAVTLRRI